MLAGEMIASFADSRAFCENLRRAENLRLQTIYRIGRNILLFTINDGFSISGWSNYLLGVEGSQIG
jgi:hypothetical protein